MSRKLFRTLALAGLIVGVGKFVRFHGCKMENGPHGKHWAKYRRHAKFHKRAPWHLDEDEVEETGAAEAVA